MADQGASKEKGFARKALKSLTESIFLLGEGIWAYEEKTELAIILAVGLLSVLVVYGLLKGATKVSKIASKNPSGKSLYRGANLNGVLHLDGGNVKIKGVNLSSTGSPPPRDSSRPSITHFISCEDATADLGEVNLSTTHPPHNNDYTSTEDYYPMGTASDGFKGVCLILNYFQYTAEKVVDEDGKITETVNQNRYGTMKDADDLKKLFTKLQFKVLLCNDLSRKETRKKLKEVANFDYSAYSCFILCILAHGEPNYILCDKEKLSYKEIIAYFNVRTLVKKPKLFIVQACQGDAFSRGVLGPGKVATDNKGNSRQSSTSTSTSASPASSDGGDGTVLKLLDSHDGLLSITAQESDRFAFMSSYAGTVSIRTWFIQDLVSVFGEHAAAKSGAWDLTHLCTRVTQLVNERTVVRVGSRSGTPVQIIKQIPEVKSSLTKRFRFV